MMVPIEFKVRLVSEPFRRTQRGRKVALLLSYGMPERQLSLLRRFTGETLFELLVASDEPMDEMVEFAWQLHEHGLIASASDMRLR